jgi:hypothetical protein
MPIEPVDLRTGFCDFRSLIQVGLLIPDLLDGSTPRRGGSRQRSRCFAGRSSFTKPVFVALDFAVRSGFPRPAPIPLAKDETLLYLVAA